MRLFRGWGQLWEIIPAVGSSPFFLLFTFYIYSDKISEESDMDIRYSGLILAYLLKDQKGKQMKDVHKNRTRAFLLCVVMVLSLVMPITAYTQESESKVVRVGWYESQILLFARKCMRLSELLTARDFPGIRS